MHSIAEPCVIIDRLGTLFPEEGGHMYLLLESQNVMSLEGVVALVRDEDGDGTCIYRDDGTVAHSVFRPDTLARRCFPRRTDQVSRKEGE